MFLAVLVAAYALLQLFPRPLFPYHLRRGPFDLCSRAPIPPEAASVLDEAANRLRTSQLYHAGMRQPVFLCESFPLYAFFCPFSRQAFAANMPSGNIFVAWGDLRTNRAKRDGPEYTEWKLSGVLGHEATHSLIRSHLGWWGYYLQRPPDWVNEGYCEAVAGDTSVPLAEGIERMKSGTDVSAPALRYFRGYLMVRYLLEDQHLNAAALLHHAPPEAETAAAAREWIQARRLFH